MEKPLISFALFGHNQSEFIREAIESALSQTYSPLEIVFCDDCSSDNTFEIMSEMVRTYQGPHTVGVRRNQENLGLGRSINRVMEICRGELVVVAAGDDVSVPERTEKIYRAWEESERKATSIFSNYVIISRDGLVEGVGGFREMGVYGKNASCLKGDLIKFISLRKPVVNGCTHAWSPKLFEYFGPLQCDLEDLVLSFRTLAIGEMIYIPEPLVKYRRHGVNVSFLAERDDTKSFEHREQRLKWVDEESVAACENLFIDTETLYKKGQISKKGRDKLVSEVQKVHSFHRIERQMMDEGFRKRVGTVLSLLAHGKVSLAVRFSWRALPSRVYRRLYILRERWRSSKSGGKW